MSNRDQSDAIWIRQQEQDAAKARHNSVDIGSFQSRFGFGRSLSVNSEGASTVSSSPPYSPIEMNSSKSGAMHIPAGSGRFRTSSFSSGYHNDNGYDKDPYSPFHSPMSTSAPGRDSAFRRSNSISVGAMEYNSGKNSANLGPIDEVGKMYHFGDALKSSLGQLFSAPKMPKMADLPREKKRGQMQDRVVSMLCESAIR